MYWGIPSEISIGIPSAIFLQLLHILLLRFFQEYLLDFLQELDWNFLQELLPGFFQKFFHGILLNFFKNIIRILRISLPSNNSIAYWFYLIFIGALLHQKPKLTIVCFFFFMARRLNWYLACLSST